MSVDHPGDGLVILDRKQDLLETGEKAADNLLQQLSPLVDLKLKEYREKLPLTGTAQDLDADSSPVRLRLSACVRWLI